MISKKFFRKLFSELLTSSKLFTILSPTRTETALSSLKIEAIPLESPSRGTASVQEFGNGDSNRARRQFGPGPETYILLLAAQVYKLRSVDNTLRAW